MSDFVWNPNTHRWDYPPVDQNGVPEETVADSNTQLDSTTTPLAANATYMTAIPFDVTKYKTIVGSVIADQTGTLYIQQSNDGVNFDVMTSVSVTAVAPNWAASTAYSVGNQVNANGNVYRCTTAGTSASSGSGPSGVGTSISDGTVTWSYIGPLSGQGFEVDAIGVKGRLFYVNGATAQGMFRLYAGGKNI
jgi:hypothetical protein